MKKKIILISIIVVVVVAILSLLFYLFKDKIETEVEPISAIPESPALIVKLNYPNDFINNLKDSVGVFSYAIKPFALDNKSILNNIDTIENFAFTKDPNNKNELIWSIYLEGQNNLTQLLVIKLPDNIKQNEISDELKTYFEKTNSISNRDFMETKVFEVKSRDKITENLHYYISNGLVVLSSSQKLIESSIESLKLSKSVNDINEDFKILYKTEGKKELANVYVNMKILPNALLSVLSDKTKTVFNTLKSFSSWTELDLSFDEQKLNFNGFTNVPDSISLFANVLNSQASTRLKCSQILPDNTSYYFAMAFNNIENFNNTLSKYNTHIGKDKAIAEKYNDIKTKTGIDVYKTFYPLIDNEVCYALTMPGRYDKYENSYTVFGVKSQSSTEIELNNIINGIKIKTNQNINTLKDKLVIDENTNVDIYILPFEGLPEILFGNYFSKCSGKYLCCVNNFMIFANSKNSLFKIVYDIVLNKTLETNIDYNLFTDNFSEKTNLFVYFSMLNGIDIFKDLFNDKIKDAISSSKSFYNIGYQLNKNDNMLYNNIVIKQQKYTSGKPQTIWESRLDTTIMTKPSIVINHDNGSKEILVQDYNNNIYLLSNSGREIWKIKLKEKIESDIYQIDLYKNGKLQYLFSTKTQIHLLDRLGNYVEKYPVKLRDEASSPIALFDYENNKDYRIIVPCVNNSVYMYDGKGNIVKGWTFDKSENKITTPLSHYVIGKEDYIVFHDDYKAYFINRKGENKLEFLTKFKFSSKNKIYYDYSATQKQFVTTDENGVIRIFYQTGKQDSIILDKFTPEHYFALKDLDRDGSVDYIFLDKENLKVYNKQKKVILSYTFEDDKTLKPVFYTFPCNQIKIGVVLPTVNKIYLLNSDGSTFEGFPLLGLTQFSISYLEEKSEKFNLIVGGQENLLYNYEINEK